MKRIIWTEIKNDIMNFRFLFGTLLIVIVTIVSEGAMLTKLANSYQSAEGPGWFVGYSYCMNGINTLLFIPIAVALPAGENAEAELRSRFFIFSYTRTGKREYLFSKAIGLFASGGFLTFLAMVFLMAVSIIRFGHIPALMPEEVNGLELYSKTLLSFPRIFLNGALWALVGGLASVVSKNRYMAYAVPFVMYYVLTTFQERYYQKLFFLSPRYWATTLYYGDFFCIGILLISSLLIAFLFMLAIKRRLEHA